MGQNLDQIISNVVIGFTFYMGEYLLKQNVVVVQTSKWKVKANIIRNATFEGR